eukprot:scaffold253416_cov32-Tisochrysis_lutea.AAC.5
MWCYALYEPSAYRSIMLAAQVQMPRGNVAATLSNVARLLGQWARPLRLATSRSGASRYSGGILIADRQSVGANNLPSSTICYQERSVAARWHAPCAAHFI